MPAPILNLSSLNGSNGFVLNGIDKDDASGFAVSNAGDVNGDGIDDLIIGAFEADPDGKNGAGESYVVFGGAGVGNGGAFNLSSLNGSNGFVINGVDANDNASTSISSAGDINGDGIDDLIIGAPGADPSGKTNAGESYVVFGSASIGGGGFLNLSSLNGGNGFVINGVDTLDRSGTSVSSAGDINNDGIDDLIIGAPEADPNNDSVGGESYVVFGGRQVGGGGSLNLSMLNGANGFVISGIDIADRSGRSVSWAGDVNGDRVDDLIIGAAGADPAGKSNAGESYVIFGSVNIGVGGGFSLSTLNGSNGFVINGVDEDDASGFSVSGAADINGDGVNELIVGAFEADPKDTDEAGKSYVVFGSAGLGASGSFNLASLNGSNGFAINGIDEKDFSGFSIKSAGDINGDRFNDLIIGAFGATANEIEAAGKSYIIFGGTRVGNGGSLDLSSLNGNNGFVINGIDSSDFSGFSVSGAGDINGDGVDDFVIGAYDAEPNGTRGAGESYVVFGVPTVSVPTPPDAVNDNTTANQNTPLLIPVSFLFANDIDPNVATVFDVAAVGGAVNGSAVLNTNGTPTIFSDDVIIFTPTRGFSGNASFVYTLSDGSFTDTATVSIAVGKTRNGNARNNVMRGTPGNDIFNGRVGQDRLLGLAGNDRLDGAQDNDLLDGGAGNDLLSGAAGDDLLVGGVGVDILRGGSGNDRMRGGADNDTLRGGTHDDQLFGDSGVDQLSGDRGNDRLVGGNEADTLLGGVGNDLLNGGLGNDKLTGGSGDDIFVLANGAGVDVITDFTNGSDRLGLFKLSLGQLTISQGTGGNSDKTFVSRTSTAEVLAILTGVKANTINKADFVKA